MKDPYKILLNPYVTEKTMSHMEMDNRLEFVVRRGSTKGEIKEAFERLFEVKVAGVNVKYMKDGKHAIVKFAEGYSAEDVAMRIGIF